MKKLIKKITSWKYFKDTLITTAVVLTLFLAVSADGFSDLADKKFWWNFWSVVNVVAIIASVLGWVYLNNKDKSSNK